MNYQTVTIQGKRCLIGQQVTFQPTECFGLKVGDRITQIGHHMSTSSREDKFYPYITYSGQITIYDEEHYAFLLPEGGVTGLENPADSVYIVYTFCLEFCTLYRVNDKNRVAHPLYPLFYIYQRGYYAYPVKGESKAYMKKIIKNFRRNNPIFQVRTLTQQ